MDKHAHETKHETATTSDTNPAETTAHEPSAAAASTSSPFTPRPRKSKKKLIAILIAVILLIVAIAAGSYYYFAIQGAKKDTKQTNELAAATKFASPQALVDEVTPELKGKVAVVSFADGLAGVTADGLGVYSPPSYQVAGKKFSNLPAESTGVGYTGDSAVSEANYKALVTFFDINKFKRIANTTDNQGSVTYAELGRYVSYAEYESDTILCAIRNADATQTEFKTYIVSIGCGDKTSYKKAADALSVFYDAYTKNDETAKEGLVFGAPVVSNGADGYRYAKVYQEDEKEFEADTTDASFTGLYSIAPGEDSWHYFTGVQGGVLACSEYNNDELKKAFKGYTCYDETAKIDKTVQ